MTKFIRWTGVLVVIDLVVSAILMCCAPDKTHEALGCLLTVTQ